MGEVRFRVDVDMGVLSDKDMNLLRGLDSGRSCIGEGMGDGGAYISESWESS